MKLCALAVCLLAALGGCGGDDDGNLDCGDYSACGGDPVGEWTVVDACIDGAPDPEIDGCPDATATIDDVVVDGTVMVRDDGSYATNVDIAATVVITVPLSCLQGGTCADLSQAAGVPCNENGDACDCMSHSDSSDQESGTWEVNGSTLTLTDSAGDPSDASFCVQGDVLKAQPQPDQAGDPQVTLVLTR